MSFWVLLQVLVDLLLLTITGFLWVRLSRPAKDDPRLSRGLQLLQSKISVLEDLSDRTETQVQQVTALMEQKIKEIQSQILAADRQIQTVESSMSRSLDVAKIFQDKIPHQEIIERQNTIKYVKAARMAHHGASVEQIAKEVDLSIGEIEFIAKVNREQLQFSEKDLPEWARQGTAETPVPQNNSPWAVEKGALSQLGQQFRQAMPAQSASPTPMPQKILEPTRPVAQPQPTQVVQGIRTTVQTRDQVRKFEFPKIDVSKNLG